MQNPFKKQEEYPVETIDPIPPGFRNLCMFMRAYVIEHDLTQAQANWFLDRIQEHVPGYLVSLWQGAPEMEFVRNKISESKLQFFCAAADQHPRMCGFGMHGKIVEVALID